MAKTLRADISASISALYTHVLSNSSPSDALNYADVVQLLTGDGDNQAQVAYNVRLTATGASVDVDLSGGLTDAFGTNIQFQAIKAIFIKNKSTTDPLSIGAAAANPWGDLFADPADALILKPGAVLLLSTALDGYAVVAGSSDVLHIDPGAATIQFDLILVGVSFAVTTTTTAPTTTPVPTTPAP